MNVLKQHDDTVSPRTPWRFVPMGDYVVPSDLSASALKKRWHALGRLLGDNDHETGLARAKADLHALPDERLDRLVPPIDWTRVARALADVVDDADHKIATATPLPIEAVLPTNAEHLPQIVVGQPYCDHSAILVHWAQRHHARLLSPPTAAQILDGDTRWLETLRSNQVRLWVLPALERCFLRHSKGLDLLRHFLERALSGALGPGMIGCDSWAFAFVQHIWPLPETSLLTLQAFDGDALADTLVRTQQPSGSGRRTRFLSARNGEPLLPEETPQRTSKGADARHERVQTPPELTRLAAHCRGNPGLARHYWRKQLHTAPERQQQDATSDQAVSQRDADEQGARKHATNSQHHRSTAHPSDDVVWVASPDLEACSLPPEAGEEVAFVLHALLLHRGLSAEVLALLLPFSRAGVISQLLRLQARGVLLREGECWQVAPLAYPAVREFLHARAYLTDAF